MKVIRARWLSFFLFFLVLISSFQNCSDSPGILSFNGQNSLVKLGNGNGDGYFGKPADGNYVRVRPPDDRNTATCSEITPNLMSAIQVMEGLPKISYDQCADLDYEFATIDQRFYFSPYNPDYVAFNGSIFQRKYSPQSQPDDINEAWCYSRENSSGVDVIVKKHEQGDQVGYVAQFLVGKWDATTEQWQVERGDFQRVQLEELDSGQFFTSSDFALSITRMFSTENKTFAATVDATYKGEALRRSMACFVRNGTATLPFDYSGMVRLWALNGASGYVLDNTPVVDASRNSVPGIAVNRDNLGMSYVDGKLGRALYFDGTDDYLAVSKTIADRKTFSIAGWFKTSKDFSTSGIIYLENSLDREVVGCSIGIAVNPFDRPGWLGFMIFRKKEKQDEPNEAILKLMYPGWDVPSNFVAMNDGEWHHYVVTALPSVSSVLATDLVAFSLFIDGELKVSKETALPDLSCITSAQIAATERRSEVLRHFQGVIDEISIWERALAPEEVLLMYNRQK